MHKQCSWPRIQNNLASHFFLLGKNTAAIFSSIHITLIIVTTTSGGFALNHTQIHTRWFPAAFFSSVTEDENTLAPIFFLQHMHQKVTAAIIQHACIHTHKRTAVRDVRWKEKLCAYLNNFSSPEILTNQREHAGDKSLHRSPTEQSEHWVQKPW